MTQQQHDLTLVNEDGEMFGISQINKESIKSLDTDQMNELDQMVQRIKSLVRVSDQEVRRRLNAGEKLSHSYFEPTKKTFFANTIENKQKLVEMVGWEFLEMPAYKKTIAKYPELGDRLTVIDEPSERLSRY